MLWENHRHIIPLSEGKAAFNASITKKPFNELRLTGSHGQINAKSCDFKHEIFP